MCIQWPAVTAVALTPFRVHHTFRTCFTRWCYHASSLSRVLLFFPSLETRRYLSVFFACRDIPALSDQPDVTWTIIWPDLDRLPQFGSLIYRVAMSPVFDNCDAAGRLLLQQFTVIKQQELCKNRSHGKDLRSSFSHFLSGTHTNDVLWDRDECIECWGQKVTVQGHGGITYAVTITA